MTAGDAVTSVTVLDALRRHHGMHRDWRQGTEPWAFLTEFKIGPADSCDSRIDALAIRMSRLPFDRPFERIAYEVKISRSDLLRELANPAKRYWAEQVAHRWVLATPPGLVKDGELPEGAGLVEVGPSRVRWVEHGAHREPETPHHFVAALARRASRAEERERRQSSPPVAAVPVHQQED